MHFAEGALMCIDIYDLTAMSFGKKKEKKITLEISSRHGESSKKICSFQALLVTATNRSGTVLIRFRGVEEKCQKRSNAPRGKFSLLGRHRENAYILS